MIIHDGASFWGRFIFWFVELLPVLPMFAMVAALFIVGEKFNRDE